jgi:hypothetical protein
MSTFWPGLISIIIEYAQDALTIIQRNTKSFDEEAESATFLYLMHKQAYEFLVSKVLNQRSAFYMLNPVSASRAPLFLGTQHAII